MTVAQWDDFKSAFLKQIHATDEIYGWDGYINGKPAENGNYIIIVRAITIHGKEIELDGPITLVK